MSISKKLDETLEKLDLDESAKTLRDSAISNSLNSIKDKMSDMDLKYEIEKPEHEVQVKDNVYENDRTALADVARNVYRTNINPVDKKEVEKKAPEGKP